MRQQGIDIKALDTINNNDRQNGILCVDFFFHEPYKNYTKLPITRHEPYKNNTRNTNPD